jgi:hypothetical protein
VAFYIVTMTTDTPANNPAKASAKTSTETPTQADKSPTKLVFSPAVMGTYEYPVEKRLEELQELLGQEKWQHQHINIKKAIAMYEAGELPLPDWQRIWLANGELIDGLPDSAPEGIYFWPEVCIISIFYSSFTNLLFRELHNSLLKHLQHH